MKATLQRDLYANALRAYKDEVPIEQWPIYNGSVSRSGLERAFRARGFPSFDRKRLESPACKAIVDQMDELVRGKVGEGSQTTEKRKSPRRDMPAATTTVRRLMRQLSQAQAELERTKRRERRFRDRCVALQADLDQLQRSQDTFSQHCYHRLRTLHV